jgi:hypothetical protein
MGTLSGNGEGPRYSVYFVPQAETALAAFGATIFGPGDEATSAQFGDNQQALNAGARRYGFHATLKAPFHLKSGQSEADLIQTALHVASSIPRFQIPGLQVSLLDDFIALTPNEPSTNLRRLADSCVRGFEPLRAALTSHDRDRRLAAGLNPEEVAYLNTWGYPYVFEGFQFHMTLTDALPPADAAALQVTLADHYARFNKPVAIDAITLCRQPTRRSSFEVWQRFDLAVT